MPHPNRALIIDRRCTIAIPVCRTLARQGSAVDIFASPESPAARSRYCRRLYIAPPLHDRGRGIDALQTIVGTIQYDEIYIANELMLELTSPLTADECWRGLLLPPPHILAILQSKNRTLELLQDAGVHTPRTLVPANQDEVAGFARELGLPLVVKGEKGESAENVRFVHSLADVPQTYHRLVSREAAYHGRPALQEFIRGPAYSVGGLFHQGKALRICAHRKLLTHPASGGVTVKGITEHPPGLLEEVLRVFDALHYTGLAHVEFIKDVRDNVFKCLEINPRLWGSIGIATHAGVDFYSAYRRLVRGLPVKPDLRYAAGVRYHRLSKEIQLLRQRPAQFFRFVKDLIDPRLKSEFEWSDPGPHLAMGYAQKLTDAPFMPPVLAPFASESRRAEMPE